MRTFAIKLGIFFAPFVIALLMILIVGFQLGELIPETLVIQWQQNNETPFIYEPTWVQIDQIRFKYHSTTVRTPKVLAIGSSRMFFFRADFLNKSPDQFYNASVSLFSPYEIRQFIKELTKQSALPSVILLGIDLPYCSSSYGGSKHINVVQTFSRELYRLRQSSYALGQQAIENPIGTIHLLNATTNYEVYRPLGLGAIKFDRGYRNDGSRYLGDIEETLNERLQNHNELYEEQSSMFVSGDSLNEAAFNTFADILQIAQDNNSIVIGVILPYRESFYTRMIESGDYDYIPAAILRLETLFGSYNAPLFDFTDLKTLDSGDEELFDGWHSGELLTLRMFAAIARKYPDVFDSYVDLAGLETIIANADNPFRLFK